MMIRKLVPEDGEAFAELIKDVENESSYMLYGPGERNVSADIQKKMIEALSSRDNEPFSQLKKTAVWRGI
ncbi:MULTISPECIES: hypothetical protein [Bacillaceae]|uniref:hypothetical protein n=1 Tax=Bacillaceae TaxID=186817 RepID=UPI002963F58F|nr:hypothetical protein [Bacillus infantis]MDW2877908.1 hypothetical protein [Bacillus infantis]